jgi:hypothetical protein
LRGDGAFIQHDDVIAGVFDVGQQMRRKNQIHLLVVRDVANQFEHLVAPLGSMPLVGSSRNNSSDRDQRLRKFDALLHAVEYCSTLR